MKSLDFDQADRASFRPARSSSTGRICRSRRIPTSSRRSRRRRTGDGDRVLLAADALAGPFDASHAFSGHDGRAADGVHPAHHGTGQVAGQHGGEEGLHSQRPRRQRHAAAGGTARAENGRARKRDSSSPPTGRWRRKRCAKFANRSWAAWATPARWKRRSCSICTRTA